jgi:hypothetical protein
MEEPIEKLPLAIGYNYSAKGKLAPSFGRFYTSYHILFKDYSKKVTTTFKESIIGTWALVIPPLLDF